MSRLIWRHRFTLAFLGGGFLINFLPFIAIRRVMYLYHYLFALVFLIMFAAYVGGTLAGWNEADETADGSRTPWRFPTRASAALYWGIMALIVVGFVYFLPFTYGWSLTQPQFDARFWVLHPF